MAHDIEANPEGVPGAMVEVAILLGGEIIDTPRLRKQLTGRKVIAADSGIAHARMLGLDVSLWVGDFDSSTKELHREFAHVEKEEWSPNKDLTDSEIAIRHAYDLGASSIILVGAFGGRADHSVNHKLLAFSMKGEVILTSGQEEAVPVIGSVRPGWPAGTVFSILAIDDLSGINISGAKWPLKNAKSRSGASLTLSNEVEGDLAVSVQTGRALLIGNLQSP